MKPYDFNSLFTITPAEMSARLNQNLTTSTVEINMDTNKPYFVIEGDWYIFPDRFATATDADDFCRFMAKTTPDVDFTVCRQDRRFRGEASVKVTSRYVS